MPRTITNTFLNFLLTDNNVPTLSIKTQDWEQNVTNNYYLVWVKIYLISLNFFLENVTM